MLAVIASVVIKARPVRQGSIGQLSGVYGDGGKTGSTPGKLEKRARRLQPKRSGEERQSAVVNVEGRLQLEVC
jgi:hypothetical protein